MRLLGNLKENFETKMSTLGTYSMRRNRTSRCINYQCLNPRSEHRHYKLPTLSMTESDQSDRKRSSNKVSRCVWRGRQKSSDTIA